MPEQGGKTKSCEIEALRAGGGQALGALHHIVAGGSAQSTCLRSSHRQVGKSVIRGEKLTKAKKYSLIGK